jgi:UDP-2,4-diacetamido-2,4,6-trideoxy-beta-L-altropyranose hydrolase
MSHLVIRADSGPGIGMGHVMRCLALAQAWLVEGRPVTFVSCGDNGSFRRRAESNGCRFIPLESRHPDPSDLDKTLEFLVTLARQDMHARLPWLVTDGYVFTPSYHAAIRAAGIPLLIVDDIADQPVYHADVLLNQNIDADRLDYHCDSDTSLLLGTRYALLRREFGIGQTRNGPPSPTVRKILVTTGGDDPDNLSLRALRAVKQSGHSPLETIVVVGARNQHGPVLKREIESFSDGDVRLAHDVDNMAELMTWADLAISGAGSTCWELAATGTPSLLVVLADNQQGIADGLHRAGAAVSLGRQEQVTDAVLAKGITRLCEDREWRQRIVTRARALVDGHGATRVVAALRVHERLRTHL